MIDKKVKTYTPQSRQHWRQWLEKNHKKQSSIWLIFYKKTSKKPTVTYSDAVDEALCFGWIDSRKRPIDDEKFMQFFSKRKTKSGWSRVNKAKVQNLIDAELMKEAGLNYVDAAKRDGSWTSLDEVEAHTIPADLDHALKNHPKAKKYFFSLSRSDRRVILLRLAMAKKRETRQKRIDEVMEKSQQV